jgi:CubicO group peptidase (beta-lactamase class C family)
MKIIPIIISICLTLTLKAQELPKQNLDNVINQLVKTYKIPNVSIAITNKDSIVYTYSTPQTDINTVFLIGSNTKSFTALALMHLVDSSLVDIDKPVSTYLNWFSFANETADKKITVRNLLNQTSGIPQWSGFFRHETTDFDVFQKAFDTYLKTLPSVNAIGEKFEYSNTNYVILGLIVQKFSGKTYPAYIKEQIFTPLKMSHSFANYSDAQANGLITGYQYAFGSSVQSATRPYTNFQVPEGHIASTAADMSLYLQAMVKGSKNLNISEKVYQQLITPNKDWYAMGWGETKYFSQKIIQHLGLNDNFNSAMFFMPQQEYGVIALANTNSMEFSGAVKEAIILTLLNKPYTQNPSMEGIQRIATGVIVILSFISFIFQLYQWRKKGYSINKPSFLSILRCILGVALSLVMALVIPKVSNVTLRAMFHLQPDYAYGFFAIAIFGILASLFRMFRKSTPSVFSIQNQKS